MGGEATPARCGRASLLAALLLVTGCGGGTTSASRNTSEGAGILYVSDFNAPTDSGAFAPAVLRFDKPGGLSGNVQASGFVQGSLSTFGQPHGLFVDLSAQLLVTDIQGSGGPAVSVFTGAGSLASNVAPTRQVVGGTTTLNRPLGGVLDATNLRIYVSSSGSNALLRFDSSGSATGNVSPTRTITDPGTLNNPVAMVLDESTSASTGGRLYVVNAGASGTADGRLAIYDGVGSLDGDVSGNATIPRLTGAGLLVDPTGVTLLGDTLFVADPAAASTGRILVFKGAAALTATASTRAPDTVITLLDSGTVAPQSVTADPATGRLFVLIPSTGRILVIDSILNRISGISAATLFPDRVFFSTADLGSPQAMYFDPNG